MILRRALVALGIPAVACSAPAPTRRSAPHTAAPAPQPGTPDSRPDDVEPEPTSPVLATTTTEAEATTTTAYVVTIPTVPPTTTTVRPRPLPTTTLPENVDNGLTDEEWASGACGGSLPPCWVMRAESGGNPRAYNAKGCYNAKDGTTGCYGKWQFMDATWHGLGYTGHAYDYPEATQDTGARTLWDGGRGCSHWGAC